VDFPAGVPLAFHAVDPPGIQHGRAKPCEIDSLDIFEHDRVGNAQALETVF
jgi:hypothetical protein